MEKLTTPPDFLLNMNWSMLSEQKKLLLHVINDVPGQTKEENAALEGILCLIDAVQDYAIDEMGIPEEQVHTWKLKNIEEAQAEFTRLSQEEKKRAVDDWKQDAELSDEEINRMENSIEEEISGEYSNKFLLWYYANTMDV